MVISTTTARTGYSSISAPATKANDNALAGQMASKRVFHGDASRYATYAVHTRFGSLQWFTADAMNMDPKTGLPAIIRQAATFEEALP